ncbi:MAG: HAD hydrolase family protein [Xanthomonadaceae bacterium]|nr:HAD hydrolase family protein [Xanthomonadaceae bacterium]
MDSLPLARRAAGDHALMARAGNIRLVCFDVDGTLTDGRLTLDSDGRETKSFHVHDGQGIVLLRQHGIEVAFITARNSPVAERRARELGVRCHIGVKDKLACVHALCAELGIDIGLACFMGDDLPDLPAMRAVGLSVAPGNAHALTAAGAELLTVAKAGKGAARELCDLLLAAQGRIDDPLPPTVRGEVS